MINEWMRIETVVIIIQDVPLKERQDTINGVYQAGKGHSMRRTDTLKSEKVEIIEAGR